MSDKRITIRLSDEVYTKLQELSKKKNKKIHFIVKKLIEKYINGDITIK